MHQILIEMINKNKSVNELTLHSYAQTHCLSCSRISFVILFLDARTQGRWLPYTFFSFSHLIDWNALNW